jgi:hypothetical protein
MTRPKMVGTTQIPSKDPTKFDPEDTVPFNPLDQKNLAIAVAKALLDKRPMPLGTLPTFRGAGIYAIYYRGNFAAYGPVAAANADPTNPKWPLYVGKAIPAGGRRGVISSKASLTNALFNRLKEHADSIAHARSLELEKFSCRFLVVDDLWIPLAESLLIARFSPVWNRLIDGFGNHDPGAGRYNGLRPRWDVLHPGRAWAEKCKQRSESAEDIEREAAHFLATTPVPSLSVLESIDLASGK